ncbi:hydrolase [Magnetovibrio sp. PR-2]|uniref:hydrolase n=1 Tax=Magnetovibrio sp. PR-2 TaxID=3120356 RepID=UPI002FCE033E
MDAKQSCLVVIDIQSKLNPVMFDEGRAPQGAAKLLLGADILNIPAMVTEQYSKGVGPTVDDLQDFMPEGSPLEKDTFSCCANAEFMARFKATGATQAILCGIEAHICVLQTALNLLEAGYEVFVVEDATASRTPENHRAGLERIRQHGGQVVVVESVLFEWLKKSGTAEFKHISQLIK